MNIYDLPSLPLSEELTTVLAAQNNVRIERIVSTGQITDWYDQDESEFVALLQGNARLEYDGGEVIELVSGDTLIIPLHKRHRVTYTSVEPFCIWLCIFWR